MSTHPMISVIAEEMNRLGYGLHESHAQSIWLKVQAAEQHQGEPVAWTWQGTLEKLKDYCPDGVTVFKHKGPGTPIPLYTHGDLVEVEQLQAALAEMTTYRDNAANHMRRIRAEATAFEKERDTLRANLAEAHELLSEALRSVHADAEKSESSVAVDELEELASRIDSALSASAEPSAPTPVPTYMEAACDKFDWMPEEALRFYAEGKHFDTDNGRTRILCTGAIASHALKGMSKEYADLKGSEQGEPSAPVERDEQEEFCEGQWWLAELDRLAEPGTADQRRAVAVVRNMMRQLADARAALARKP